MKNQLNVQIMLRILLAATIAAVGCRFVTSQAASTLTPADVDAMRERVAPGKGDRGPAPELPRATIHTELVAPKGKTIAVPADGDLQDAIDEAKPGDTITLQAGATYTGNFILPAKQGSDWIVIRTSAGDASLPPPGVRMTPEAARSLPRILTPNSEPALLAASGAHHYRLIGIEFSLAPQVERTYNLISLGSRETSLAQLPHNLILDRLYLHGTPTSTLRRGILLNSATTAVIDSYISDCHEVGADSQAIGGWNGAGPFKIVNNYLEGAGENLIIGGADPLIENLVPSDIEFRLNHCYKPLSWRAEDPSYAGKPWGVKNLFELKNAQRVLIDGNIFEHNWTMAQNGFAILFTVRNQDGKSPWSVVQDVTFTNNIVRSTASAINIHGDDDNYPSLLTRRIRIANNLFYDIDGKRWAGSGICFQIGRGPREITIENNTILHGGSVIAVGDKPSADFIFRNNLFRHNEYGIKGDSHESGSDTITAYFPGSKVLGNVIAGGKAGSYPPGNFFPESLDKGIFVDLAGRDFLLAPGSPYRKAGTDGKDVGCDMTILKGAFKGASMPAIISRAGDPIDRAVSLTVSRNQTSIR